jgi:hypothetical protein
MFKRILSVSALLVLLTSITAHAAVELTLDPVNGALAGPPGATVGWGYTLINNTLDTLTLTGSRFDTSETWVAYTDFVQFLMDNAVIAPGGQLTQVFNFTNQTGTGSVYIDPLAPVPGLALGQIVLVYNTDATDNNRGLEISANATVSTPEPSTYALLCISLGVVGYAKRRMGKG